MNRSDIIAAYAFFPIKLWTACSITTNILGALGNLLTLAVISLVKQLHKPNYILLSGVCVNDLALNAFHLPFENIQSYYLMVYGALFGTAEFCIWESAAYALFFTASNYGQMMVSFNRFMAVFAPIIYRKYVKNRAAVLLFLVICMALPTVFYFAGVNTWFKYEMDAFLGDCREYLINIPAILFNVYATYTPLSLTLLVYMIIFVRLSVASSGANRAEIWKRARGSGAMFACSIYLLLSMFPQYIFMSYGHYDSLVVSTMWLKFLFRLSYSVNPLLYFLLDSYLRRALIDLFKKYILRSAVNANDTSAGNDNQRANGNSVAPSR